MSDYKFYIDTLICGSVSYKMIDIFVAVFDYNGISSSNVALRTCEHHAVLHELFPNRVLLDYFAYIHGNTYEDKLYNVLYSEIKYAAKDCYLKKECKSKITLKELYEKKYLETQFDPITKEELNSSTKITIKDEKIEIE